MIDFKEGAVCYACGKQWVINTSKGGYDFMAINDLDYCNLKFILGFNDLQLNEPRKGYYIPKSELDTEEKYNQAIKVFGLFGYIGFMTVNKYKLLMKDNFNLIYIKDNKFMLCREHEGAKVKLTFDQLMAIGELKRKMNGRDAIQKAIDVVEKVRESLGKPAVIAADALGGLSKATNSSKPAKKRKAKEAYRILESMGAEWDNVEGKWFKVGKEWL